MQVIQFIRTRFKLVCLISFILTSGAGLTGLLWPRLIVYLAGRGPLNVVPHGRIFLYFAFLLVTIVGAWFLIIMSDPDANRPLLALATSEKLLFVLFFIMAMHRGALSFKFFPIMLGDLAMGLACLIYLVFGSDKPSVAG